MVRSVRASIGMMSAAVCGAGAGRVVGVVDENRTKTGVRRRQNPDAMPGPHFGEKRPTERSYNTLFSEQ